MSCRMTAIIKVPIRQDGRGGELAIEPLRGVVRLARGSIEARGQSIVADHVDQARVEQQRRPRGHALRRLPLHGTGRK